MDSNSRLTSPAPRCWKIGLAAIAAGSFVALSQADFVLGQPRRSPAPPRSPTPAAPTPPPQSPPPGSADKPF